jgi:hypothetical protein
MSDRTPERPNIPWEPSRIYGGEAAAIMQKASAYMDALEAEVKESDDALSRYYDMDVQLRAEIADLKAKLETARNDALEEAAKACEKITDYNARLVLPQDTHDWLSEAAARDIRALKEKL